MAAVAARSALFERTMDNLDLPKSDVNSLVMNYLITEGYPSAAKKFAAEANIVMEEDQTHIEKRVEIRDLILQGDLHEAIEEINELDVQILDQNKKLHFALLRLQLIELIKKSFTSSDQAIVAEALEFATQNLAPYVPLDDQFRVDLERAMALLIVPEETWSNPKAAGGFGALAELVQPELRRKTAQEVNEAILRLRGCNPEANINFLAQARAWTEQQGREKNLPLPARLSLGLDGDNDQSQNGQTEGGDTEMSESGAGGDAIGSDIARYTNIPS